MRSPIGRTKMSLYEIYAEAFLEFIKNQNTYCYTWEFSENFDIPSVDSRTILNKLLENHLVSFENAKDGRWWI